MHKIFTPALAAGLAAVAGMTAVAAPAAAQVQGIATANPTAVIFRSAARQAAYQQIQQTYSAQIQQAQALNTEINTLQTSLDTNKDNQLSEAELKANPSAVQQIQAKEQQIATTTQPVALAQYYVIEQLINDYENARNQVVSDKKISMILSPDAIQYGPDSMDVTDAILAALDKRLPTVSASVPAGWQPRRDTVQTHQTLQQIALAAAQQAAARQQAQQQQGQTQTNGR